MTARETAFKILLKFDQTRPQLDNLINSALKGDLLSGKERKFVSNLVSGVVRHQGLLDWKIATFFSGNYKKSLTKFKIILRLALYEIDYLDFIPPHATANEYVNLAKKRLPKSLVSTINAIIRTYLREGKGLKPEKKFKYDDTKLSIQHSFPEWLIKRWLGYWQVDFVAEMCQALNRRPTFDLRVNLNKISSEDFIKKLADSRVDFTQSKYFSHVFKVSDIQKIQQLRLLQDGYCTVQDESGVIVADLIGPIKPGDCVLDTCAAPGGKYTGLYEKYSEEIFVFGLEINQTRLKIVRDNCHRLDYSDKYLVNGDAVNIPFQGDFDFILIDAPCSGFGTIQKHPDIKWRRSLEEILNFQRLQGQILTNASKYLKSGGFLVYSTCTIDPSENELVIEDFLKRHNKSFKIVPPPSQYKSFATDNNFIRAFPHTHDMEGAFAAKLQKID